MGQISSKREFLDLMARVESEYGNGLIYPQISEVFQAFELCRPDEVKVVIIGQDPYHGEGEAHGLAFSVRDGIKIPPSLRNIFKEIRDEGQGSFSGSGDLSVWARQGVLLLNACLTVRANEAGSHRMLGWEWFTDAVVHELSLQHEHLVFLLWGNFAKAKEKLIDGSKHLVLKAAHPSPLSAYQGFFGCGHFSSVNEYLAHHGRSQVSWSIL